MNQIFNIPSFIISMKGKDDSYLRSEKQLSDLGMKDIRKFEAIIGKDLIPSIDIKDYDLNTRAGTREPENPVVPVTINVLNDLNNGRYEHSGIPGKGALGCYMSHVYIWNWLINQSDHDYIFIFEDDMKIKNENVFNDLYDILNTEIKDVFDIILVGYSMLRYSVNKLKINEYITKYQGLFFGTQGYLISKKGANFLLKYMFPISMQIDSMIGNLSINFENFNLFYLNKNYIDQYLHKSSIQDICIKCEFIDFVKHKINGQFNIYTIFQLIFLYFIFYYIIKFLSKIIK